jgi:hypothetical protein
VQQRDGSATLGAALGTVFAVVPVGVVIGAAAATSD